MDGTVYMHGYLRADGKIGIRNNVAVIYTCLQVRQVAERIARSIPRGEIFGLRNGDDSTNAAIITGLCQHPNIAATVIVGLDDEDEPASVLVDAMLQIAKPVASIQVLSDGGTVKAVLKGIRIGNILARQTDAARQIPVALSNLIIGVIDDGRASSNNGAYPAVEWVVNWITARRGTVICSSSLPDVIPARETLAFGQTPALPGIYRVERADLNALLSSGAHLILFISGNGSIVGSVVAPVIKICGNAEVFQRLGDDMDIDAGQAIQSQEAAAGIGRSILEKLVDIAAGEPSKAEVLQHKEYYG